MNVITIVIQIFVLLFAITVHEAAHAWAAKKMGDPTAANMGRATLNPLAHIDPFGTILLPLLLALARLPAFGWAKPVLVNPRNFRNPRRDNLWVSFAGPAANLSVAAASLVALVLMKLALPSVALFLRGHLHGFFGSAGSVLGRGFHPLEGLALILLMTVLINTYFALFNLIPIPPLDGSGVLMGLLSDGAAARYDRIRPFGFILILLLIYMGLLDLLVKPVILMIVIVLG